MYENENRRRDRTRNTNVKAATQMEKEFNEM